MQTQPNNEEVGQNFPDQEDQQSQSSSVASNNNGQRNEMTENAFSFQRHQSESRNDDNESTQRRSSDNDNRSDLFSAEDDQDSIKNQLQFAEEGELVADSDVMQSNLKDGNILII